MARTEIATPVRPTRRWAAVAVGLVTCAAGSLTAVAAAAPASAATTSQYGTLDAPNGRLPRANKCGEFSISWDIHPPEGIWGLELSVVDPRGEAVMSFPVLQDYAQGKAGTKTYTLCTNNTRPGIFTLRGTLSVDDGTGRITTYQMAPDTFRLAPHQKAQQRKAKRHRHHR